jgi:hypothetical protein
MADRHKVSIWIITEKIIRSCVYNLTKERLQYIILQYQ